MQRAACIVSAVFATILARRGTHGHNRADKGREGQGCAAVERTECSTRSFRRDVQDRIIQTTPENVSSSPCANFRLLRKRVGQRLKVRRLSPLVPSAASRQQD